LPVEVRGDGDTKEFKVLCITESISEMLIYSAAASMRLECSSFFEFLVNTS